MNRPGKYSDYQLAMTTRLTSGVRILPNIGQSDRPSNPTSGSSSRIPPNNPARRSGARQSSISDDERQYSRKISKTSSYGHVPPLVAGNIPMTGRNQAHGEDLRVHPSSTAPSAPPLLHTRMSLPNPGQYRAIKQTSSRSTPSSPYQSPARRGLPEEPSRSNPTAPIWDVGPSQSRGGFNTVCVLHTDLLRRLR